MKQENIVINKLDKLNNPEIKELVSYYLQNCKTKPHSYDKQFLLRTADICYDMNWNEAQVLCQKAQT